MSKEQFTKGPWRAAGKEPSRIYGWVREDKECIIASTKGALGETGPNAYLIAAAPEMYEEIEREHAALLWEIQNFEVCCEDDECKLAGLMSAANRKASILAKARGKRGGNHE